MTENRIAILIPTLSRPENLLCQLSFYNYINTTIDIYICDSTPVPKEIFKEKLEFLSTKLSIKYFHAPGLNDRQAIYFLLEKCNSKYSAFIGDDDFFIPDGMNKAADFLEKNRDYRVAYGQSICVDQKSLFNQSLRTRMAPYWGEPLFEQNSMIDRISAFSKDYFVPMFAVHRTKEFAEDYLPCKDMPSKEMGEYLINYITVGRGKTKYIPIPYLIRQNHPKRYLNADHFVDSLLDDNVGESLPIFRKHISEMLLVSKISEEDAFNISTKLTKSILFHIFNKTSLRHIKNVSRISICRMMYKLYTRIKLSLKNILFENSSYALNFKEYLNIISRIN